MGKIEPKPTIDPLDLFEGEAERNHSYLSDKWLMGSGAFVGFGSAIASNWGTRRPLMSGIQKHFIGALIGLTLGYYAEKYSRAYYADKDATYRHYIELHPDDFPPVERKKFGEIFYRWVPIR